MWRLLGQLAWSHAKCMSDKLSSRPECTKIARFSAAAAAIFTAPPQNRAIFKAPRCAISSAKKIASERRFSLRLKRTNLIPTAEFPAIPESAAKIASERRCAILVHSDPDMRARSLPSELLTVECCWDEGEWLKDICQHSPSPFRALMLKQPSRCAAHCKL